MKSTFAFVITCLALLMKATSIIEKAFIQILSDNETIRGTIGDLLHPTSNENLSSITSQALEAQ